MVEGLSKYKFGTIVLKSKFSVKEEMFFSKTESVLFI